GCDGGAADEIAVRARFQAFQDAVSSGDRAALYDLVTPESKRAVAHLPLERARGKQQVEVLDVERQHSTFLLRVADPNEAGRRTTYVMVRQAGSLVVDLLETTAYNSREKWLPGPPTRLVPAPLGPRELARIRAQEAAG